MCSWEWVVSFLLLLYLFSMCGVYMCACCVTCVEVRGQPQQSVLCFHHMGSGLNSGLAVDVFTLWPSSAVWKAFLFASSSSSSSSSFLPPLPLPLRPHICSQLVVLLAQPPSCWNNGSVPPRWTAGHQLRKCIPFPGSSAAHARLASLCVALHDSSTTRGKFS